MSSDSWPEARAGLAKLKKSVRNLWREIQLSRAQKHASKAMFIYLKNGCPYTSIGIAKAIATSFEDKP